MFYLLFRINVNNCLLPSLKMSAVVAIFELGPNNGQGVC